VVGGLAAFPYLRGKVLGARAKFAVIVEEGKAQPFLVPLPGEMMRGNVLDRAVAVIIGGAFGAIITSLVNDIIMPLVGILLGGVDFSGLGIQVGSAVVLYGNFIQAIINFLIIALALFLVIKAANSVMRKKAEAPVPPAPPPSSYASVATITALIVCMRFSASSHTIEDLDSKTSSVTSMASMPNFS
jgi:large conductance mechanosensitive channel